MYEIINLAFKQTARGWFDVQPVKPRRVINGSYWDFGSGQPIGTIIIGGKFVEGPLGPTNAGNGDAFGVKSDGSPAFARAFNDNFYFHDCLTSYPGPAPIWEGKSRPIEAKPVDAADALRTRSCIWLDKSGAVQMGVFHGLSLAGLRDKLYKEGATYMVALDGGGSSFYAEGGRIIYDSGENRKLPNIIVDWGEENMIQTYSKKTDLNIRITPNFKVGEFACPCPRCTEIPVDSRLPLLLEDIREACGGKPIHVTSGYRCPAHNAEVDGASSTSKHMEGIAADIQTEAKTIDICKAAEAALTRLGVPGGIGRYIGQNFVHVDLRGSKMRFDKTSASSAYAYHDGWAQISRPVLKRGSKGEDVKDLQRLLNNNGAALTVDGEFGTKTETAVLSYQTSMALDKYGECGPYTWKALEG